MKNEPTLKDHNKGSLGGVVLFLTFLLPILFLALSLILEVTTFSLATNSAQTKLDTLVMASAQHLPDVIAARKAFENASTFPKKYTSLLITPDGVEATVSHSIRGVFLGYFGLKRPIQTTVHAKVIIPPLTVMITLDASYYTAPRGTEEKWVSSAGLLPAGLFVEDRISINRPLMGAEQRTQGCFNDTLLPLKRIAAATYTALSKIPSYRVGAAIFPSSIGGSNPKTPGLSIIKSVLETRPHWVEYEGAYRSNTDCAAAALYETLYSQESPYRFPTSLSGIAPSGERVVDLTLRAFNQNYLPFLTVEEVIWSQSAREQEETSSISAIQSVGLSLIETLGKENKATTIQGTSSLVGLIFAGDIPGTGKGRFPDKQTTDALAAMVTTLDREAVRTNATVHIPIILFQNNTGVTIEEGAALSAHLSSISRPHVQVSLLMTQGSEDLERTIAPFLTHLRKPVVISQ
jgi:hypothetical protein